MLYVVEKKGHIKLKKTSIRNTKFGYLICKDDEEDLYQLFHNVQKPRSLYDMHGNHLAGGRLFYDIVKMTEDKVFCIAIILPLFLTGA